MIILKNFAIHAWISLSYGLSHSNDTSDIGKPVMEITLPTDDPPKRPVLPDNWGEDRPGKVPTPDFSKSIIWEL